MDLQPLTQSVLNDTLRQMLMTTGDTILITLLASWTNVPDTGSLVSAINERVKVDWTTARQVNPLSVQMLIDAFLRFEVDNATSLSAMFDVVKSAGMAVFMSQLGVLVGDTVRNGVKQLSPTQASYVNRLINIVITDLSSAIPLRADANCSDPRSPLCTDPPYASDLPSFFKAASARAVVALYANADKDVVDWMFPPPTIMAMMFLGLGPWLVMRYVATFIKGPWNATDRPGVSFYDGRYGELILQTAMIRAMAYLATNTTDRGTISGLLARMNAITVAMVSREQSQTGGLALKRMYTQVASLSDRSKSDSARLGSLNSKFETRRDYAISLYGDSGIREKDMRRKKFVFLSWLVAYAVVLVVSVALIVVGNHSGFMLQAGFVLTVLSLYLIINAVRKAIIGIKRGALAGRV